jgi:protein-tyrosine-phosphatase/DNA-binding transcriptional ArsR family regulator
MFTHTPPQFLGLLAHDVRWQLLSLLAKSDYRVHELVEQTGRPMNLVSYHLGKLRGSDLVHERRSSADGRDVYYSLDLEHMRGLLQEAGMQLHPSLCAQADGSFSPIPASEAPVRVLFLCTRNSARSQIAEGLLRHMGGDGVEAFSAGDEPASVHPYAVRAMAELGIDISRQRAKHKDIFDGHAFHYVVTVCDYARENCPTYANQPSHIHWSIPDPVTAAGADDYASFSEAAQTLQERIGHLITRIAAAPVDAGSTQEETRP